MIFFGWISTIMLFVFLTFLAFAAFLFATTQSIKMIHNLIAFVEVLGAVNNRMKNIDSSHGIFHAIVVMVHAAKAIKAHSTKLSFDQTLSILLAALLHDTDDRKFFPESKHYYFANNVTRKYFPDLGPVVIKMISLVSCSDNGNKIDSSIPSWHYIPRYADRLDAIGIDGIKRCLDYNKSINNPTFLETTPRATSIQDLYSIATPERFELYQARKTSVSVIDHMYDKLMHLKISTGNSYIDNEMEIRHRAIENFLLEFGRTGQISEI